MRFSIAALCLLLLTAAIPGYADSAGIISSVKAESSFAGDGNYQGILDGASGEGSLFFQLSFSKDGTVSVEKQYGGHDVTEVKKWKSTDTQVEISSETSDSIREFDGAQLTAAGDRIYYSGSGRSFQIMKTTEKYISVVFTLLILLGLILLNELFRRYKVPAYIFYFVMPLVLIPFWMNSGISYWFKWVKLYSIVAFSVWIILMRFTKLGEKQYAKFIVAAILSINIAEAVTQDFTMGYLPNILNALAGILNILTISNWKGIHTDSSKEKDMVWPGMPLFWIIAYDIWNWTFIYLNLPGSASSQFMVLLAPTLAAIFIKKGTWMQGRAFTLAGWMIIFFSFPRFCESLFLPVPHSYNFLLAAGILSFSVNLVYAFFRFRYLFFKKAPSLFEVGQNG